MNTIPISAVTQADLYDAVRETIRSDADATQLPAFLARIDWSHGDDTPLRAQVALLEGWTADYSEGLMPRAEYLARLLRTLPAGERAAS